jgi:hypothetical protein
MEIPPPNENGWRSREGQLEIVWMTLPPAPDSVLECVNCGCKTGCKMQQCSCNKAGLQCTDVCNCEGCANIEEDEDDGENLDSNLGDDDLYSDEDDDI